MKTDRNKLPLLEVDSIRDYVIALDGIEFAFPKDQLDRIRILYNEGMTYKEISKEVNRDPYEVIVGLLEIVRSGRWVRSFY